MFELKTKIIKHLQVKGNKFLNEQNLKLVFKSVSKNSKKSSIKLIQIIIAHSCLIFKTVKLKNTSRPYYFKNSVRISFAVKQNLKFIINQKNIQNGSLLNKFENLKTIPQINQNKIFYCYRWFF
jgi:hypothetical protein